MLWYDELQRQVEQCAGSENSALMNELLVEIGVEEMVASNERYYLQRRLRTNLFDNLRQRFSGA